MTQGLRGPAPKFIELATKHLSNRLAKVLTDLEWTPRMMAAGCGGAQSGWRSKMNGTRLFQLSDLVALTAATGTDLFTAVAIETRDQLVDRTWHPHLTHRDRQIPLLRGPDQLWTNLGDKLVDWLTAETGAGRGPLVTQDVFIHHLLAALDARGVPSAAAALERSASRTVVTWNDLGSTVTIDFRLAETEAREQRNTEARPVRWSFAKPDVAVNIVVVTGEGRRQPRLLAYAVEPRG